MSTVNQGRIVPNKVLVTGASGLLGVAAIERFLSAGWEVVRSLLMTALSMREDALWAERRSDAPPVTAS